MTSATGQQQAPRTRLPDFCSLPVLFSLLVLFTLVVLVMLAAPGSRIRLSSVSVAILFAVWLALVCTVALCKLRPALERLSTMAAYGSVWLLMVVAVLAGSLVVWWLDQQLHTNLAPENGTYFVSANGAVAALVGAAVLRYFYVLAQWQDRVQAASQAQVEALQARIRPHFLFNSMNTAAALVRLDPDKAEQTIEGLSALFRAALGTDERPATLGEELDLVDRYLAIEQLRLGERLRVERDLAAAPRELRLPRLLLQPLVENAVYHGIQSRPEGGTIALRARRSEHRLQLIIANTRAALGALDHDGHGHALANVRSRLGYYYGERASLVIDEDATAYRVNIALPLEESLP